MLLSQILTENGEWYEARMGNLHMLHWIYYCNTFVKMYKQKQTEQKLFYSTPEKKTVQSKVIFVWEVKQKTRNHHTDEIEAHRYQVANELKERTHIHT